MHRRIMISYNIVGEIKRILSRIEIDMPTTFYTDMSSIITYCTGCVHMTYEPMQYVYMNPLPVWYVGMEVIYRGKRLRVKHASIC
jgi:hypothetical protein